MEKLVGVKTGKKLCIIGMTEKNEKTKISAVVQKLKSYEDTELEPAQVKALYKQSTYGCKWCERYENMEFLVRNENGVILKSAGNVPAGGKCKFCPNCGRKMRDT